MTNGLMWQTEYMWGHALNDGMIGGGESTAPQNANDRRAGKADSNYDIRQTMTTNVVWMLPFGPGQRFLQIEGVAGKIVGGWELSAIHSTRTGRAITFTVSRSSKDLPDGNSSNQRPDVVPGVSIYPANQTIDNWFNIAAFAMPKRGTWGNAARNLGRGPGVNTARPVPAEDRQYHARTIASRSGRSSSISSTGRTLARRLRTSPRPVLSAASRRR